MNSSNLNNGIGEKYHFYKNYNAVLKNLIFNSFKLRKIFKSKVNEKQLSFIADNLAKTYKAGIQINLALELIIDILPNKRYRNSLKQVLASINQGKSLSQGFAQIKDLYPEFFVGIISIGEGTGKLYIMLKALSIFYSKLVFIKNEIKSASAYPLFVLTSLLILLIFLVNEIIPNFCEIYKSMNIPLPASCKFLYDINITLKSNPIVAVISIISWSLIIAITLKLICKKLNMNMLIKIRTVKLFFEYIMVLLLSIVTSAGINISHGIQYCEKSINFNYLRKKMREINSNIIKGKTLTESLKESEMFSKYSLAIIKVSEESGTIDEGLKSLSEDLENKLSEQIKKYIRLINPIFIFCMAGFIIIFLLTFVLPLFNDLQKGIR